MHFYTVAFLHFRVSCTFAFLALLRSCIFAFLMHSFHTDGVRANAIAIRARMRTSLTMLTTRLQRDTHRRAAASTDSGSAEQ
jgi:hypothetical protein